MFRIYLVFAIFCLLSCANQNGPNKNEQTLTEPHVIVLGIAQDAGYPQANCKKSCCEPIWGNPEKQEMVSCIGFRDPKSNQSWLFDATPDFKNQLQLLQSNNSNLAGIFLTHGHIGHYTGLMQLGREAMGADQVPTYAMPRMTQYLIDNGPWSQLVKLKNISLQPLNNNQKIDLGNKLFVTPMLVPHRDEFSETVGYLVEGPSKKLLFIPDIDKWHKWDIDILQLIKKVDFALLDGCFYRNGEIRGRDMSLIPHPFVEESLDLFSNLSEQEQQKIHFIHLNHTNPLLNKESQAYKNIATLPYNVCSEGQIFKL